MGVTITSVGADDVESLVEIHMAAFQSDMFSNFMLLNKPANAHRVLMERSINAWLDDANAHFVKATDEQGNTLGWACWLVKEAERDPLNGERAALPSPIPVPNEGSASEVRAGPPPTLGALMRRDALQWGTSALQGRKHAVLQALAVHPSYQKLGVGTRLAQRVVELVDAECGLPCWAHASPVSHGLYGRAGFREIGSSSYDLDEWAERVAVEDCGVAWSVYRFRYMLRPAAGREGAV